MQILPSIWAGFNSNPDYNLSHMLLQKVRKRIKEAHFRKQWRSTVDYIQGADGSLGFVMSGAPSSHTHRAPIQAVLAVDSNFVSLSTVLKECRVQCVVYQQVHYVPDLEEQQRDLNILCQCTHKCVCICVSKTIKRINEIGNYQQC